MASNGSDINLFVTHIIIIFISKNPGSTFINAFESSPVHCAKSLPSLKRRRPAYAGTVEMLVKLNFSLDILLYITFKLSHTVDQYHVLFLMLDSRHTLHGGSHSPMLPSDL
jgi:hypothetical protein